MARQKPNTVPTSVILTHDQKAFIKKVAEQENRTFSHQVRAIISDWVTVRSEKKSGEGHQ
jgi:hypothetical protein